MSGRTNVLILTPDSIRNPLGGLGVYMKETLGRFSPEYKFYVLGPDADPDHQTKNYAYTSLSNAQAVEKGASIIKKIDVIHAMDWTTFRPAIKLADTFGLPFIAHVHLSEGELMKDVMKQYGQVYRRDLENKIEINGLERADLVIQVSHGYARRFPNHIHKTKVVHNGIDVTPFMTIPEKEFPLPASRPGNKKMLYIGRTTYQKGLVELMQCDIPDDIDLYLVTGRKGSDPSMLETVIQWADSTPNVHYLGPQWGEEKRSIMHQVDAQIVPSLHEPFGIVALEAIATGSVLLSSFVDGMSDFLDESYAINTGINAATIQKALQNYADMSITAEMQMVNKASQILPDYTWKKTVQRLETIYQSIKHL